MGRKAAQYDPIVLERIRASWVAYKDKTGISQVKAAELLGMNQSAFSQYLRGTVPLNNNFISKFAILVKEEPSNFDESLSRMAFRTDSVLKSSEIEITYGISGVVHNPPKIIVLPSNYIQEDRIAVEIDVRNHQHKYGSIMVAHRTVRPKEGDEVLVFNEDKTIKCIGELVREDSSWFVRYILLGRIVTSQLEAKEFVFTVIGGFYPPQNYKRLYNDFRTDW
ncbi:hypothetical protein [Vibrio astriarenae]|uniref:hypothetical protein n=1 Tax=Vibrio astriarenae TaxID=1481923 RepID=UPI003734D63E